MEKKVTDPQSAIVLDSSSGISLEEQQEILDGINAMTSGNRLVSPSSEIQAKKRGYLFPALVNAAAVVILAAGFFLLSHIHGQQEQDIREASVVLGLTERALIQEIRQETSRQLRQMEDEIDSILMMLSAADTEYRLLQDSLEVLTEAQQQRAAALLLAQEGYRSTLMGLHDERARIIEDSRAREAALRAQAEEHLAALAAQIEQRDAHLAAAMEELRLLSTDQQRAERAESQMNAYYAAANSQINAGLLDEASATLQTMREFLDAPSLLGIRAVQVRRPGHLAAISALEGAVAEARRLSHTIGLLEDGQPVAELAELQERYAAMEQLIASINLTGNEHIQIIAEQVQTITSLTAAAAAQQETLDQWQGEIQMLTSQVQETAARAQQSEAALEAQQAQHAALNERTDDLQYRYDDLQRRLEAALGLFQ